MCKWVGVWVTGDCLLWLPSSARSSAAEAHCMHVMSLAVQCQLVKSSMSLFENLPNYGTDSNIGFFDVLYKTSCKFTMHVIAL